MVQASNSPDPSLHWRETDDQSGKEAGLRLLLLRPQTAHTSRLQGQGLLCCSARLQRARPAQNEGFGSAVKGDVDWPGEGTSARPTRLVVGIILILLAVRCEMRHNTTQHNMRQGGRTLISFQACPRRHPFAQLITYALLAIHKSRVKSGCLPACISHLAPAQSETFRLSFFALTVFL